MPEQASPSVFRHFDCPIMDVPNAACYSVAVERFWHKSSAVTRTGVNRSCTLRYTVHDTENLTFSADDRAENPHISARTLRGFCTDNQRIPCGTISKFYSYNDISNNPCGVFLDRLALLRTKFAFWFPPFSN